MSCSPRTLRSLKAPPLVLGLCLAGCLLGFVGCAGSGKDADTLLQEAAAAAAEGKWHLALELSERCVAARAENVDALLLHGFCLFEARRNEEAIETLETAAALAPDRFLPHYFLGWLLCENGRCGDAVAALKRAFKLKDQHRDVIPDLLVLLGRCCLEQNLPEGKGYLQALRRYRAFSRSPELYNALGVMYLKEQSEQLAKEFFLKALEKDPDNAVVLQNLAVLHDHYLREPREAMRYYRYSLKASQLAGDATREVQIRNRLRQMARERLEPAGDRGREPGEP